MPPLTARKSTTSDSKLSRKSKLTKNEDINSGVIDDDEDSESVEVTRSKKRKRGSTSIKASSPKKKKASDDEEFEASSSRAKVYDSDALDDDSDDEAVTKKRKKAARTPKKKTTPRKAKKKVDQSEDDNDFELEEGQEVVGKVVQPPKTGLVPAGQISQNTLDFLNHLKDPECNDRQWFKLHEPVYRVAEKEWKDFVEAFTDVLADVDPHIPHLPPKDVIHRIYRDIRFSNDKTPYKKGLSASFSRSGRKGIFAGYHIAVKPGNETLIAAGSWCPGRNELNTIRANILRDPQRLRDIISDPEFVEYFGEPKPHPKGERQNVFGMEDELKVAPKGVGKDHPDIDLLKCRSFAVVHRFPDSEVLDPDFKQKLGVVAKVMQPFVHCLNDMMTILQLEASDNEDDEDAE